VRVLGLAQVWQAQLGAQEGAARVHPEHQVEALELGILGLGEADGAGVVDQDVYPAESGDGSRDGRRHLLLVAHVSHARDGFAAGRFDLFDRLSHGAG
jgi:hypothetical protein